MNEKLSMLYIPKALRHLMLNARTSAWVNQKGYTTFPYINHYIYPKSTQAFPCKLNSQFSGNSQKFPIMQMTLAN